jgi:8-oxo-dGTP pyrophosphatase MutT (NUDIX family)
MRAEYTPVFTKDGSVIKGPKKVVDLPFSRTSARAIIIRRSDRAIVGALHTPEGRFALPGGDIDDGESPAEAVLRELKEENIELNGSDDLWQERMDVSYFEGFRELAVWYLFVVDDAELGHCEENLEVRWVDQAENLWHPLMHKRILLVLEKYVPDLINVELVATLKIKG